MCEQDHLSAMPRVGRRDFAKLGALGSAGVLAGCATAPGMAMGPVTETPVSFAAPGGELDGFWYASDTARPAVLMWPDIAGIRPAKKMMARRLAESGYSVLLANPYYRSVSGQQFEDFDDWRDGGMATVRPWMERNTYENQMATIRAAVDWLDRQGTTDSTRGIGTQGYCMTGSWALRGLAANPGRVKAAASFHGGSLVGDDPLAPVNLLKDAAPDAAALIAIAKNDDAQAPNDKVALRAAAEEARADIEVEVYQGDHGWTVLDSPVYMESEAERAWAAMLAMYTKM